MRAACGSRVHAISYRGISAITCSIMSSRRSILRLLPGRQVLFSSIASAPAPERGQMQFSSACFKKQMPRRGTPRLTCKSDFPENGVPHAVMPSSVGQITGLSSLRI